MRCTYTRTQKYINAYNMAQVYKYHTNAYNMAQVYKYHTTSTLAHTLSSRVLPFCVSLVGCMLCGIYTLVPYYMHLCIFAYKCMYIAYTHPFITTLIFYKLTSQDIVFL